MALGCNMPFDPYVTARWQELIAEYDIEIFYKPGKQNGVADFQPARGEAERHVNTYDVVSFDFNEQIRVALRDDRPFGDQWRLLKEGEKDQEGLPVQTNRIMIPANKGLERGILLEHHATPFSGYLRQDKLLASIRRLFR
ncbi:hypothetical protein BZG36_05495 [Bifiguratus adelaidae]|uniref:Reverse transcriptase n=1 Tax=Bifiguratus adelaidae TaxID=1938954 RepID=A0A261XUM5_9FUNG|nr:hypothetical protein BZG36_05495 [Bifiguratus adelaidae]